MDRPPGFASKCLGAIKEPWSLAWGKDFQRTDPNGTPFSATPLKLPGRTLALLFLGMLLAFFAIGACSIHAPFFALDDWDELFLARASHSIFSLLGTDLYHFFRPVKNLLFLVYNWLYLQGGMVPVRALALAIGAFSACAVFKLCCRLMANRGWALVATAIWLLSPTLVSCTVWLSASNILLMAGLAAAAITCHDLACASEESTSETAGKTGWIWNLLAPLLLFLALATYEGAVSMVALFVVVDWYLHPLRLRRRSTWMKYFRYGLVVLIYLIIRHEAQSTQQVLGGFSGVSRPDAAISSGYLTALHTSVWFWPFNRMAVFGGYYWGQVSMAELAICYLIVVAATIFSLLQARRYPYVSLGIVWFLLAFAPMSNVLGFRNGPYCDSYIALASVGAAIALTAILRTLWPSRMTGFARLSALVIVTLLIGSRVAAAFEAAAWSSYWNDPMVAYQRSLITFPKAFDVMTELAKLNIARGDYQGADELASESIKIAPDRSGPYAVRAVVAEHQGRYQDALKWLAIFRSFSQSDAWDITFEADIYANHLDQPKRAEALYQRAIASRPWTQDALRAAYELAYLQAQQGHQAEAIALWEELLTYHPTDSVLHWDLSVAYAQQGNQKLAAYHRSLAQGMAQPSPAP